MLQLQAISCKIQEAISDNEKSCFMFVWNSVSPSEVLKLNY